MQDIVKVDLTLTDGEITTTSLEIARVFERRHDDVMNSIKSMGCSQDFTDRNFSVSEYKDSTGRTLPCHIITRNGFDFLAMGFTGEKAAKYKEAYITEFSRMEKVLRVATPSLQAGPLESAHSAFKVYHDIATLFELKGNQALLSADKATSEATGVSFMKHLGITHLAAPVQEQVFTPTEIGKRLDPTVGAIGVNVLLCDLNLQESYRDTKNRKKHSTTETGKQYGEYLDTGKVHSNGTPVKQFKWYASVIPLIEEEIELSDF